MRASVRMTRYLESWGAARPFAHLNQRESVSSSETLVSHGRRPKVGPSSQGAGSQGPGKGRWGGADAKGSFRLEPHSLHVQDGSGLCSASLPPGAFGEMRAFGECSRGLGMSLDSWFPRPSSDSVPGACSLDGPCI